MAHDFLMILSWFSGDCVGSRAGRKLQQKISLDAVVTTNLEIGDSKSVKGEENARQDVGWERQNWEIGETFDGSGNSRGVVVVWGVVRRNRTDWGKGKLEEMERSVKWRPVLRLSSMLCLPLSASGGFPLAFCWLFFSSLLQIFFLLFSLCP